MQPVTIFHCLFVSIVCNQSALGWRTFYISPTNSNSCPADHCYSLQDVINNQSYFIDSNTTLELMPGMYKISEKVGQLAIHQVQNFLVKQFAVDQNVTVHCDSNATFGITVIESSNVIISGIQIIHCSAALMQLYMIFISGMFMLSPLQYIKFHFHPYFQQWLENPLSCDSDHAILPCIATVFFIDNSNVSVQRTTILHSQHIGLFTIKNNKMSIVGSLMAYNNINGIIIILCEYKE